MPTPAINELARLINTLHGERRQHAEAIAQIDATFASLGISAAPAPRRGRPPKGAASPADQKPTGKRRRRKAKDGMTGEKFLMALLAKDKLSTADVNKRWAESGRKNAANVLLGKLVKDGKVKRAEARGVRGSVCSAA